MNVLLYLTVGAILWILGLQAMMLLSSVLRRVMAINLMGSGVFLMLVALAGRESPPDPVLQALVLTGLVVAVSATAFALRLHSAATRHAVDEDRLLRKGPGRDRSLPDGRGGPQ